MSREAQFGSRGPRGEILLGYLPACMVFYFMNEGKLMNVSHSTISAKDKSLTNTHLRQKWKNIVWH